MHYGHGDYSYTPDELEEVVSDCVAELQGEDFDSIAVSGMSGVIVGVPVAMRLGKTCVVVRKDEEKSHAGNRPINLKNAGTRIVFLDDFVSKGNTLRRVHRTIASTGASIVGSLTYTNGATYRTRGYPLMKLHEIDS